MTDEPKNMRSIWYLVGMLLLIMGAVITVAGIEQFLHPPAEKTVLADLHPGLWWGCIMVAVGAIFFFGGRNRTHG